MSSTGILFNLFRKLDYRDKENSGKKKLTGILLAYLVAGTAMAFNFYNAFDEKSFVMLSLTSNLFLIALIVLNDFDNLFLASRSFDVINSLPVKSSEFFLAKFFSAALFLMLFITAVAVPQMVFFYFINHDFSKLALFFFTNTAFCFFAIGLLLFIYCLIILYSKKHSSLFLNVLQILFFVFIFYSSTISSEAASRNKGTDFKESIFNYGFAKFLPQSYFSNSVYDMLSFDLCILVSILVFVLTYAVISKKYFVLLENVLSIERAKTSSRLKIRFPFAGKLIQKYYLSNKTEAASFGLVRHQLANSRFLRIKFIPVLFMPLIFVILGVVSDSDKFLFFNKSSGANFFKTVIPVVSPSITLTLLMCSRLLISNTKILDDKSSETKWIFDSLPVPDKKYIIKGANKFIYLVFIAPVILLMFALLCIRAVPSTIILNLLFIISGLYFINSVALLFDKTYPFTLESSKFNSASKILEIFLAMFLGIALFLIQIFVFQNIIFVLVTIAVFILLSLLLNRN